MPRPTDSRFRSNNFLLQGSAVPSLFPSPSSLLLEFASADRVFYYHNLRICPKKLLVSGRASTRRSLSRVNPLASTVGPDLLPRDTQTPGEVAAHSQIAPVLLPARSAALPSTLLPLPVCCCSSGRVLYLRANCLQLPPLPKSMPTYKLARAFNMSTSLLCAL